MVKPISEAEERTTTPAGRRFRVGDQYHVGREKIREFARAVQNVHGAHRDEDAAQELGYDALIAPPTFASVIGATATRALLDSVLTEYDLSQVLQTDQVFEMYRPILAGDRITSEVAIESIRQFGDNDFIHVQFALTNQHDDLVQSGSTTIVARRGVEVDANITDLVEKIVMTRPHGATTDLTESDTITGADQAAGRTWAPVYTLPDVTALSAGDQLPPGTAQVTRGDLANYAGVAGDPNPIHFSDHAAQLAGLPTVVAHGLLTMGLAADYLTAWLGDPTAIVKLGVRFAGFVPVTPDAVSIIDFTGKIKSLDPVNRTATILLSGTSEGRKLFGRAVADVRFS